MPRKPRIDFKGAWHHVMHRGARRAPIFTKDEHCLLFLDCIKTAVEETELEIHAYSLMPNHYHLLTRSRHGNLSNAMRKLNALYTQRLNLIHRWDGPVFRGRFHSQPVKDETKLPYIMAYIHLNPLRANLVTRLQSECWTSHRAYIGRDQKPEWLTTRYFLDLFDGPEHLNEYVLALHRKSRPWPDEMSLEYGWIRFTEDERKASKKKSSESETRFIDTKNAVKLICEVTGETEAVLRLAVMGPRANPARRFAVWALKQRTTLTHREIGRVLAMSADQIAHVLSRIRFARKPLKTWKAKWLEL
jgi:REP element-mobilizing transposase RayT